MICYIKIIDYSFISNAYSLATKIKLNIKDIEYNLLMSFYRNKEKNESLIFIKLINLKINSFIIFRRFFF